MPCNQNCNQGRNCDCKKDSSVDRAVFDIAPVIIIIILISCIGMGSFMIYRLVTDLTSGQQCEVTVKFKDSSATYIGRTV
jgi:hypothetical protein